MAVLLGVVLRVFAAGLYAGFRLVDGVADFVLALRIEISWEFLAVALFLIWCKKGGQFAVLLTLGVIAWLEWGTEGGAVLLALGWSDLRGNTSLADLDIAVTELRIARDKK